MPDVAIMNSCCLLGKVSVILSDYGQRNRGSLDSKSPQFQQNSCGTHRCLSEAIALYKGSGYVEVKAFNAETYAHHWFEKTLGKKTQTGRVQ